MQTPAGAIEPFRLHIADAAIADLHRRLDAARPFPELFADDWSLGAPKRFVAELCRYWRTEFDWRGLEARINREPNYIAALSGLSLHFVHRRSSRPDAAPLLLLHGWPSSFLEFLDLCDTLAEPPAGEPAFHVIVPSLPGHGFSTTRPGMSPRAIAGVMAELMAALGYANYLVQGGNWGSVIGSEMARRFPERITGLHLNSINASPPSPDDPLILSGRDQAIADAYGQLLGFPHFALLSQKPASLSYALNDSPMGLAAWIGEKLHDWADTDLPGNRGLSSEWLVSTIALYWFTQSAASSSLIYAEMRRDPIAEGFVNVPTAVAVFPREMVVVPRPWAERAYRIVRWCELPRGGHFAAIEAPELFVDDLRDFTRQLQGVGGA